MPPTAVSVPPEARGAPCVDLCPPRPVRAWIQTPGNGQLRIDAVALSATPDAVLIEWGFGQAATAAWVFRSAVRNRAVDTD